MATIIINPTGVSSAFRYPISTSAGKGYVSLITAQPPSVNPPIFYEPGPEITNGEIILWIIVTGPPPNWGGAEVWASVDASTFGEIGAIMLGGVQGLLTAPFPSGLDPDTTDTLSVDLTMSGGQVISGSNTDADLGFDLAYVDGELVGYSTTTLTAPFMYNLTAYLRRGMYGTTNGAHAAGTQFGLLNTTTFVHTYPPNLIGRTIYFKFLSFNTVGGQLQSLANVVTYQYTLTGAGRISNFPTVYRVPTGTAFTVPSPLHSFETKVLWLSPTGGAKTTNIPAASGVIPGFSLVIAATEANFDQHTVIPAGGTIGGQAEVQFFDSPPNGATLTLEADQVGNNWIIS